MLSGLIQAAIIGFSASPVTCLCSARIVTGIAAILFFLKPLPLINVSLYGTVWIILAANLSHYLALVLRPTLAGFSQIERHWMRPSNLPGPMVVFPDEGGTPRWPVRCLMIGVVLLF